MKKSNATWENIEKLMIKVKAGCSDAGEYANDAVSSVQNAYKYLDDIQELLKIRKEYEDQSYDREELMSCVNAMQDHISCLADNIIEIKKGR